MFNPYLYEKLANARQQELLQEAEQRRLVAQLPRRQSKMMQNPARLLAAFISQLFSSKKVVQPARVATGQL